MYVPFSTFLQDQYNKFTIQFAQQSDEFQLSSQNMAGTGTPVIQVKNTSLIDFDPPLSITQYRLLVSDTNWLSETRHNKTCLRGLWPGKKTQTSLLSWWD